MTGELFRGLAALLAPPQAQLQGVADALELGPLASRSDHTELFTLQLVPYASVYLGNEGHIGGEARERIAGFWHALEARVPREPDHLGRLLALYGDLAAADQDMAADHSAALRHRQRALLGEHLLSWLPLYLSKLEALSPPFYGGWAALLESALEREGERLAPPAGDCVHWMEALPLPGSEACELGDVVDAVLSPVRSGLILTRSDLADAARALGIAQRIGERRFMLDAMLRQRPKDVLGWLGRHLKGAEATYSEATRQRQPIFARATRQLGDLGAVLSAVRAGIQ